MIDNKLEKLKDYLRSLESVAVAFSGGEVMPDAIERIASKAKEIYDYFKGLGFLYVSLDLGGYRTGSMNDMLSEQIKEA